MMAIVLFPLSVVLISKYDKFGVVQQGEDENQKKAVHVQMVIQLLAIFCFFYAFFVPPRGCCQHKLRGGSKDKCSKYGRYLSFFCLFSMFVVLPFASICYSFINWNGHFTSDNVMLPWNVTYALLNLLLIVTYFGIATDFIYAVRANLLERDIDKWQKHVEEIVHFVK